MAAALIRHSRDTVKALSEMFFLALCASEKDRAHSLGLLQYPLALSPLIDTAQLWGEPCTDFTTGNEDEKVVFSYFLRF